MSDDTSSFIEEIIYSDSQEETLSIGSALAHRFIASGTILAFQGDLGAGKTTLIKGMISHFLEESIDQINSPTFTYLNIYDQTPALYHFDLYRLKNENEFIALGFADYFEAPGVCFIEWPERIFPLLPKHAIKIEIHYMNEKRRKITLKRNSH